MSSAAVQPSATALANRQYQSTPPQSREQYYAPPSQSHAAAQSAGPARIPNGASPSAAQHYSPSYPNSVSSNTPRAQSYIPSNSSPTVASAEPTSASRSSNAGIIPPRTSSHSYRASTGTAGANDTRTSRGGSQGSANAFSYGDFPQPNSRQSQRSGNAFAATPTNNTPTSGHGRSASHPPRGEDLPRENSTVINRIIASDPQEDIARERARVGESQNKAPPTDITPVTGLGLVGSEGVDDGGRGAGSAERTRQQRGTGEKSRKETKFGEYILGQTLGEGEFGKVKMGWKREGGVQVAIKLIRKDSLGTNPSRLPKIYREIAILRGLQHPNIVRLHEMVETERHIGIILEYASGGELFDYILQHRYLKDNAARRLFAQLVSGVGYLHKKGIVHRDLKLENLLLDRNRNIIITDFGFANTFTPGEELGDEIEYRLGDRDFVRSMGLEHLGPDGHRRGDLMQTSCGSPCYAAPELVVSDSLYTGRKVDVWSCGVILYAMLAGYLPFDDDPANPEGDNINLLYKYIVSTPLTFPDYVTPHARDLLKRILVPDPRKRADLFEVARHSWLSEFASVVGFITSSTTSPKDIANTTVVADPFAAPHLGRSASVREPQKPSNVVVPIVGGLVNKTHQINEQPERSTTPKHEKRNTVQVEYVAPQSATSRNDSASRSRARNGPPAPISIPQNQKDAYQAAQQQNSAPHAPAMMPPPTRPARDQQRATSEYIAFTSPTTAQRPSTQGSMTRIPLVSRSSYGSPSIGVTQDSAAGRFSQPERKSSHHMPASVEQQGEFDAAQPQTPGATESFNAAPRLAASRRESYQNPAKGHKRASTIGERIGSIFGRRNSTTIDREEEKQAIRKTTEKPEKREKRYPPTSMKGPIPNDAQDYQQQQAQQVDAPRKSTDSRRTSFTFSRSKTRDSDTATNRSSRRFSLVPSGLKKLIRKSDGENDDDDQYAVEDGEGSVPPPKHRRDSSRARFFSRGQSRSPSRSMLTDDGRIPGAAYFDDYPGVNQPINRDAQAAVASASAAAMAQPDASAVPSADLSHVPTTGSQRQGYSVMQNNTYLDSALYSQNRYTTHTPDTDIEGRRSRTQQLSTEPPPRSAGTEGSYGASTNQSYQSAHQQIQSQPSSHPSNYRAPSGTANGPYPPGFNEGDDGLYPPRSASSKAPTLQKHKKFSDAYDDGHSSGSGKRVMDFFRRMGKQRNGE